MDNLLPPFCNFLKSYKPVLKFLFILTVNTYLYELTYRDALPLVFFLFRFQCQFNEQLLQFLITVVDAELFKAIDTKYFKTVDIQETHKAALHTLLQTKQKINKK